MGYPRAPDRVVGRVSLLAFVSNLQAGARPTAANANDLARRRLGVLLNLETSYEETCRVLRILITEGIAHRMFEDGRSVISCSPLLSRRIVSTLRLKRRSSRSFQGSFAVQRSGTL